MRVSKGCNASWYEMNISSADDQVSPCCFYAGAKDHWENDFRTLDEYWNSPNLQQVRKINSGSEISLTGGCEGCYFLGKSRGHEGEAATYFPQFLTPFDDLSPKQRANWLAAIEDYENGRTRVRSTPLRFYVNFGFACNLSCTMCHQVPRRQKLPRQVNADVLLKWSPYLKAAIDITVIGGEPFALKEAIKFITAVIDDPEFEPVQLTICTNGTLLHRHMDLLAKKRKLQLAVSLDTIGHEFEQIRIGADWKQIEKNIFDFQATGQRLGYPWQVQAPCMLMKTNVPKLVDFAEWCIANDVQPGFYDFINAEGIEKTHEVENVVAYPQLLEEIPEWERYFILAVDRLRHSKWAGAGEQLNNLYVTIRSNKHQQTHASMQADIEKRMQADIETRMRTQIEARVQAEIAAIIESQAEPTSGFHIEGRNGVINQQFDPSDLKPDQTELQSPSFKQSIKEITPTPIWEALRRLKRASKSFSGQRPFR
jgi:MoaA/NifB/PqqE/SkfB family radical SAM enzyme